MVLLQFIGVHGGARCRSFSLTKAGSTTKKSSSEGRKNQLDVTVTVRYIDSTVSPFTISGNPLSTGQLHRLVAVHGPSQLSLTKCTVSLYSNQSLHSLDARGSFVMSPTRPYTTQNRFSNLPSWLTQQQLLCPPSCSENRPADIIRGVSYSALKGA